MAQLLDTCGGGGGGDLCGYLLFVAICDARSVSGTLSFGLVAAHDWAGAQNKVVVVVVSISSLMRHPLLVDLEYLVDGGNPNGILFPIVPLSMSDGK